MSKKILFGILLSVAVVFPVNAVVMDCGVVDLKSIFLSTERSDIYTDHSNIIHLDLDGLGGSSSQCKKKLDMRMAYIDISDPASASMMTVLARLMKILKTAYSGKSKGITVRLSIDTNALALAEVDYRGVLSNLGGDGRIRKRRNFKVVAIDLVGVTIN